MHTLFRDFRLMAETEKRRAPILGSKDGRCFMARVNTDEHGIFYFLSAAERVGVIAMAPAYYYARQAGTMPRLLADVDG